MMMGYNPRNNISTLIARLSTEIGAADAKGLIFWHDGCILIFYFR
jgi:hypothetical protein